MDKPLLTKSQVARLLGISGERVRQLSDAGTLPCRVTPLGRLYDPEYVERFAASRTPRPHTDPVADAVRVITTAGLITMVGLDADEKLTVAHHWHAVHKYNETGDDSDLDPFRGRTIGTREFETCTAALEQHTQAGLDDE